MSTNPYFQTEMSTVGSSSASSAKGSSGSWFAEHKLLVILGAIAAGIALILIIVLPAVLLTQNNGYVVPTTRSGQLTHTYDMNTVRDDGTYRIVVRSFNGNPAEVVADWDFVPVNMTCNGNSCSVKTPGNYKTVDVPVPARLLNPSADQLAVRLFMQGAFGASRADLDAFNATYGGNVTAWILAQMALPVTSHREYLRKRTNIRQTYPTCMPQCPNTMGSVSSPCSAGSRWTRVAILENDQVTFVTQGRMTVSSGTAGWDLSFGGVTRTTISNFLGNIWPTATNVTFPATFVVCSVQEVIGSIVQLSFANLTCPTGRNLQFAILNPPISFGTVNTSNTQQLGAQDATFATLSGTPDVLILQTLNVACQGTPTYFGYGGNFYQFDPRLVLLTNTPSSPSSITPVTGVSRCASAAKTFLNEDSCVTTNVCPGTYQVCGSPYEVASNPLVGARFLFNLNNATTPYGQTLDWQYPLGHTKSMVWKNIAFSAADQLRQRVAWALAQIFTLSQQGLNFDAGFVEPYSTYYDIFVRNAFGSYRQILREVSYNPSMAQYLTYLSNQAFAVAGSYPDENYARELMQLFSIGLYKLNNDYTQQHDAFGNPLATYSNDDIVTFARIWTGFQQQSPRSNIESSFGINDANNIDPMRMNVQLHDFFPKAFLDSGYVGDGYPLCTQLPEQHWLKPGATYRYTWNASIEGPVVDGQNMSNVGLRGRLVLSTSTSALYRLLCAPDVNGRCTYPDKVVLTDSLPCDGKECNAGRVLVVVVMDPLASLTRYYTYETVPCVGLTLFNQGQVLRQGAFQQCANPLTPYAGPACCNATRVTTNTNNYTSECLFANEMMNYATAQARCAARGMITCPSNYTGSSGWANTCAQSVYMWTTGTCKTQIQVFDGGFIGLVDPAVVATGGARQTIQIFNISSLNNFRLYWNNSQYPSSLNPQGCGAGCTFVQTILGQSCLCSFTVVEGAVFNTTFPSVSMVNSSLYVGSVPPASFGTGVYSKCTTSACTSQPGVTAWILNGTSWNASTTIFQIASPFAGEPPLYLLNFQSIVYVGTNYSFRNPPNFMPLLGSRPYFFQQWNTPQHYVSQALNEVEAYLTGLFHHPNVAPFVSYLLIQRMVTSNPSPRYVDAVATAFRTGKYGGMNFSNTYGDLGATVAAILLDREARSPILEADAGFGAIREPLHRVVSLFRSMQFRSVDTRDIIVPSLMSQIGMEPFFSPSVFGFYLPANRPFGPVTNRGLVSPEAQISTTPQIIGLINGLASLVDNGLSSCNSGFGYNTPCNPVVPAGNLTYTGPAQGTTNATQLIDDLDTLFTGGRLNETIKQFILNEYINAVSSIGAVRAYKYAQKMFLLTSEFHTTNANVQSNLTRVPSTRIQSQGRPYKNVIVIFMNGGLDSYNLLVPDTSCNLYSEYSATRTNLALNTSQMITITPSNAASLPCAKFAVHSAMPNLAALFGSGEAAFLANIGPMIEPVSKSDFLGTSGVKKKFPPSLFAHNVQQLSIQNLDPLNIVAKGVLGRAATALQNGTNTSAPFATAMYSIVGTSKLLEGGQPLDFVDAFGGFPQFYNLAQMRSALANFTSLQSGSAFAETFAASLQSSINVTTTMGPLLGNTTANVTWGTEYLSRQFSQVAKLIKLRNTLGHERAMFLTAVGGFDTHNSADLVPLLAPMDRAIGSLVTELKAQGIWSSTVILTLSDFGRTLTSNGIGSDHSWGGNSFMIGGSVNGGQIYGQFPSTFAQGTSNNLDLGRGRVLPTTPLEGMWNGVLDWLDVPASSMNVVLPNKKNFPSSQMFTRAQLFKN